MGKTFSYGKECIDEDDILAVVNSLKSDWLTQGPRVGEFELALGKKFSSPHVVALTNGTAALHLTALAFDWKKGDVVLTSPLTFLASANCIVYAGATPDFVDIDPVSYTMDPVKLEEKVQAYLKKGVKIRGVIAVDFAGHPCDWQALRALADKYGFDLVNDACHALGAAYRGDVGYAAKYADAAILSFHPVKHITTGEGGAVLTTRKELADRIRTLRSHGMTKDPSLINQNEGPWYYEMHEVGFNYRITDIQCALGISQLAKLDRFIAKRREIAAFYDRAFAEVSHLVIPRVKSDVAHAYHLYPLQVRFEQCSFDRRELFDRLKEKGINAQVHYFPVHLQPYYSKNFGYQTGHCPNAESFYQREISLPMYPLLQHADLESIAATFLKVISPSG